MPLVRIVSALIVPASGGAVEADRPVAASRQRPRLVRQA